MKLNYSLKFLRWKNTTSIAERIHSIVMEVNPQLIPASLYRMPAYKHPSSGKIICFFRSDKYFTFGLTEDAQFPQTSKLHVSSWFIEEMNDEIEQKLKEILRIALR